MIPLTAQTQTMLEARSVNARDFIWFTVKDRTTGAPFGAGYWSDLGDTSVQVINAETGLVENRTFSGAGSLISIGAIPRVSSLTIQNVTVTLSQVSNASDLIRQYDAKQGKVEIWRGLFEKGTLVQADPAMSRFLGFINLIDIETPAEGGEGAVTLTLSSHTQEMTKSNTATRSNVYQTRRNPNDVFRQHSASVGTWELKWGRES